MTIASQGQVKAWRYWPSRKAFVSSTDNLLRHVRDLIDQAVDEHLLSDVPVASFLSGEMSFTDIVPACRAVLESHTFSADPTLEELFKLDAWARQEIQRWILA